MADDVVERLLRDPVERLLDLDRKAFIELDLQDDREPDPALDRGDVRLERLLQAVALDRPWPQLEDERAHLGERLALELAQLREARLGGLGVAGKLELDAAADERHREERLGHRVVQLAGEVRPLGRGGELGSLAAQVALESLALGHVARGPVRSDEHAGAEHARGVVLDRHLDAITADEVEALDADRGRVGRDAGELRLPALLIRGRDERSEGPAERDLVRLTGDALDGVRDEREATFEIGLPDDVRRGRHEIAVARLRLAELRLGATQPLEEARVGERDAGLPRERFEPLGVAAVEGVGDLPIPRGARQRADRHRGSAPRSPTAGPRPRCICPALADG